MEERSGFFVFMGGMALLVVVATGLSIAVEGKSASVSKNNHNREAVTANIAVLESLKLRLVDAKSNWAKKSPGRAENAKSLVARSASIQESRKKIQVLKRRETELQAAVSLLAADYLKCRTNHRSKVWSGAMGEQMAVLKTKDGREYSKVRILRVIPSGLEIDHEYGKARISSGDLGPEWEARFQWSNSAGLTMN